MTPNRRPRRWPAAAVAAALLCAVGTASADNTSTPALRQLNLWIVDRHIVPGYRALVTATSGLRVTAEKLCSRPDAAAVGAVRKAYHKTADAWTDVQHLRFGPIELESRSYRFYHWPDRKNAVSRHLTELLQERDNTALAPVRFQSASVAVQGLPALERLLFDPDLAPRLSESTESGRRECAVLNAIAQNLHAIAVAVHADWTAGDQPFRAIVATAGNGNVRYFDDREATLDLFKSLHGGLSLVADVKLERPLGSGLETARVQRAETWRSGRTIRNIRRNLAALQRLYADEGHGAFDDYLRMTANNEDLAKTIAAMFASVRERAAALPDDIDTILKTPAQYAQLQALREQIHELRDVLASELSVALGIPVGFNALDGD